MKQKALYINLDAKLFLEKKNREAKKRPPMTEKTIKRLECQFKRDNYFIIDDDYYVWSVDEIKKMLDKENFKYEEFEQEYIIPTGWPI